MLLVTQALHQNAIQSEPTSVTKSSLFKKGRESSDLRCPRDSALWSISMLGISYQLLRKHVPVSLQLENPVDLAACKYLKEANGLLP